MSVRDHGLETLKKAAEEITPGDKSNYYYKVNQFDPRLYKVDQVNSLLKYEGWAKDITALDSEAKWLIKRTIQSGSITTVLPYNDDYDAVWDDRTTLFPTPTLLNQYSLEFDGINDYVSFGNTFNDFDVGQQWSMSFWINVNNLATRKTIYSKTTNDANVYGLGIYIKKNGKIFVQARTSGYLTSHTGTILTFVPGTWQHFVVTFNGATNINGFRFYLDSTIGNIPGSAAIGASLYSGQTAIFGSRNGSFLYSGYIDEVSFWSKALSQAEVTELYNSGSPLSPSNHSASAYAVNWFRMGDNDTYPIISDNLGSDDGTMTNMTADDIVAVVP